MDELEIRWLMTPEAGPMPALEDLLDRPVWHRWAACKGGGHQEFIVELGGQYDDHVRQLCAVCPMRQECLEAALDDPDVGFWGGTTPTQRRQIRRGRAVA
jgi:hypothetical protein